MKEKIVSIKIINPNTTRAVLESGQEIECWHIENDHPQVGEYKDVDDCLDPFTELTNSGLYDQRKKPHRSPFY